MADVATTAGVSHQTVSRVLNEHPSVRPETRAKVLDAIEALGYRPNLAARALASRRSATIGVLSLESPLFGPATTLYAVERAARDAGYFVSVTAVDELTGRAVTTAMEHLVRQGVDGIVAITPLVGAVDALGDVSTRIPIVVAQGGRVETLSTVGVDQVGGAALVTQHLLDEGAPTVWHVAAPDDWVDALSRLEGWRDTLEARGARIHPVVHGDWSARSGYEIGLHLAARADVDAVFVANDQMALGLLRAFNEHGLRVPADVLVAGFDDMPEAAFFTPPLTTVRQDLLAVGRLAIEQLVSEIGEHAEPGRHQLVPARLQPRQSTVGQLRSSR